MKTKTRIKSKPRSTNPSYRTPSWFRRKTHRFAFSNFTNKKLKHF